jgi:hypothetical protein
VIKLVVTVSAVAALATLTACTLLLPTEELITPCVSDEECEAGFECLENACLPLDEGDEAGASG